MKRSGELIRLTGLCPEEMNPEVLKEVAVVQKGACEACVVPAAVCKAMYVASGLALPKDVVIQIE